MFTNDHFFMKTIKCEKGKVSKKNPPKYVYT